MKTYHAIQELEATGLVTAGITLRHGGVSRAPYASMNLAEHVGDDANAVAANREIFFQQSGLTAPRYCRQIHSACVIDVDHTTHTTFKRPPEADALISARSRVPLGIFTADCVPIFILDVATPAIGLAHAGWRGTFAGIAVNTLAQMQTCFGTLATNCVVHLGPSIQKCCYTVSPELLNQFTERFGSTVRAGRNLRSSNRQHPPINRNRFIRYRHFNIPILHRLSHRSFLLTPGGSGTNRQDALVYSTDPKKLKFVQDIRPSVPTKNLHSV